MTIEKPSVQSLFLMMKSNGNDLASGTGFIVVHNDEPYLITNWHNLAGRNPENGKLLSRMAAIPDEVIIYHNRKGKVGQWVPKSEKILIDDKPIWLEHPIHERKVDVVALKLTNLGDTEVYSYSPYNTGPEISVTPGDTVSVVGFPFGLTGGGSFAIWSTGFMATEMCIDQNGLPKFLVDCRSRPGQSGSAVIAHRSSGSVSMADGSSAIFGGPVTRFLGIYSGRINEESDLGIVLEKLVQLRRSLKQ